MIEPKQSYFFYYEEGIDCWTPVPVNTHSLVDIENLNNGESIDIKIKRFDMTATEYLNLENEDDYCRNSGVQK